MVKEFSHNAWSFTTVPLIISFMSDLNVVVAPLIPAQSGPVEDEIVPGSPGPRDT